MASPYHWANPEYGERPSQDLDVMKDAFASERLSLQICLLQNARCPTAHTKAGLSMHEGADKAHSRIYKHSQQHGMATFISLGEVSLVNS